MPLLAAATTNALPAALLCASAMALACATLSVFVVTRRWAFIGEGIAHSGFGGAGTAWMLALLFPALDGPDMQWLPYCGVVVFCLLTAVAIGAVTRRSQTGSDTAIGIFMVASVAWGFVAQSAYAAKRSAAPAGWETFLFGDFRAVGTPFAVSATLLCLAVVATVWLLGKEIVAYCYDPATAEASGVRATFVHYLLILLVTLTIIIGSRVVGSVLVTALLVLPGATALALSKRLNYAIGTAIVVGQMGAVTGVLLSRNAAFPYLPAGPAIVLVLFGVFLAAFAFRRFRAP
jgi:manganese/iron transport system permease protein